MKTNILIVHQAAELYGSDRSLLELIEGLPKDVFSCDVFLPDNGPLADHIRALGFSVHVGEVVKVGRSMFSLSGIFKVPVQIRNSVRFIDRSIGGKKIDLVYTNTVAVFGGAFWARMRRIPHVWHVREVIEKPRLVSRFFQLLVGAMSKSTISNSHSTRDWVVGGNSKNALTSHVVWNGVRALSDSEISSRNSNEQMRNIKARLGVPADRVVLLLPGRINAWKGQDLLVAALGELKSSGISNVFAMIVGSPPPGQEYLAQKLQESIANQGIDKEAKIFAFVDSLHDHYSIADVVVVPSRLPEPFGRVAIEAMSYGIPVIAARHGGLSEIVESGDSGILFEPNDASDLASAIRTLCEDSDLRCRMGQRARIRQREKFSLESYQQGVMKILREEATHAAI